MDATIKLPASKSISNRALIIEALSGSTNPPRNVSDCDDTEVIINAFKNNPETIDIKAAGTAMRFLTAYYAVTPGTHMITGTERMKHRPIGILVDALRFLGADINYMGEEGFPPLKITGTKLTGNYLELPGNVSSQYISALLMIAPILEQGLTLKLIDNIVSRPYIDLTLWTMREFGAEADWEDISTILVKPQPYTKRDFLIESDWSAASYWYEMLAMSSGYSDKVRLEGLTDGSMQGDSAARYIFSLLSVKTKFETDSETSQTSAVLHCSGKSVPELNFDFINQPDLAQTFVVCCAVMGIPFRFTGLKSLKIKETDRINALKNEMRKIGFVIDDKEDGVLSWHGEKCETADPIIIDTYDDHRMALAFAPAAFRIGDLYINDPEVVTKSYPHFWEDLRKAGFEITAYDNQN